MRKIAVAIIAVFFLQVGFQFYTVVEWTNYSYPQLSSAVPPAEMRAPIVSDVENAYLESSLRRGDTPSVERRRPIILRASHLSRPPIQTLTAKKTLFTPVIITIPPPVRYETAAYKPEKYVLTPSNPEKRAHFAPEKRSFSKKALAAAKKPYDLLKFVASKLL